MTHSHYNGISAVDKFRTCQGSWFMNYVLGIEPLEQNKDARVEPLLGSWWHLLRAADSLERGRSAGTLLDVSGNIEVEGIVSLAKTEATLTQVMVHAEEYWASLAGKYTTDGESIQDIWLEVCGSSLPERLAHMNTLWTECHKEETATEKVLAVELHLSRDLPEQYGIFTGTLDEVVYSETLGAVIIRDHKSVNTITLDSTDDDQRTSQLNLYAWLVYPWLVEHGYAGATYLQYDRVRRRAPKVPSVTLAGTLAKTPSDYDYITYETWSAKGVEYPGRKADGSGAGVYYTDPAVSTALRTPEAVSKWVARSTSLVVPNVVRAHLESVADARQDMDKVVERCAKDNRVPLCLSRWNCRLCEYKSLASDIMLMGLDGVKDLPLSDYGLFSERGKTLKEVLEYVE